MSKLEEIQSKDEKLNKTLSKGNRMIAHVASYGVGIMAISLLALIFAQTLSGLFTDAGMKVMAVVMALAVGSNIAIFLIWRDQLLETDQQFKVAGAFVLMEFALLSLGALHLAGVAFNWSFAPFISEITKIAVILTLPVVGAEWVIVKSMSPASKAARAENHINATIRDSENKARKMAKLGDAAMTIREQSTLAQVIGEELDRLPESQRKYFAELVMSHHGDELANIQEVIKKFIADKNNGSSPVNPVSAPLPAMASDSPAPIVEPAPNGASKNGKTKVTDSPKG